MKSDILEKIGDLRKLQRDISAQKDRVKTLQDWLCAHPEETISCLMTLDLDKYDIYVVEVIKTIGSPHADKCGRQLLELIGDLNWPVHRIALSALFGLSLSAILTMIKDAVDEECFRELDVLCWHLLQEEPPWLSAIKPSLDDAIEKVTYYAHESNLMTLFQRTNALK